MRKKLVYLLLLGFFCISPVYGAIKAIAFDFGNTVATVDRSCLIRFLQDSFPISEVDAEQALQKWSHYLLHENGDNQTFWKEYADYVNCELPADWVHRFDEVQAYALHAYPQTMAAIQQLREQGYPLAMLSNVTNQHAAIIRKLGYYQLFNPVVLSCDIGVKKPDPKAFEILLKQLGLPPEEVLFIDDQKRNTDAAEQLGIQTIHFLCPEILKSELAKHGINVSY